MAVTVWGLEFDPSRITNGAAQYLGSRLFADLDAAVRFVIETQPAKSWATITIEEEDGKRLSLPDIQRHYAELTSR